MQKEEPLRRFITGVPSGRFEAAAGIATLSGVAVETDDPTGLALRIARVRTGGRLEPAPGILGGDPRYCAVCLRSSATSFAVSFDPLVPNRAVT